MANELQTMADLVRGLITEVDDEEKGRYVPANGVPPVAGGVVPTPAKPLNSAQAVPAVNSMPQPAGYLEGMFPEVPKDIYAPQSIADYSKTSGVAANIGQALSGENTREEYIPRQVGAGNLVPRPTYDGKKHGKTASNMQGALVGEEKLEELNAPFFEPFDVDLTKTPDERKAEELAQSVPQVDQGSVPQVELAPAEPVVVEEEVVVPVTAEEADASAVEIGADNAAIIDEEIAKGDPEDPNFIQKIWGGIKDTVSDGFNDPALRRALFAYAASRAMGYDGATFAVQVLENEWKEEAAKAKADAANARAFGKDEAARLAKARDAKSFDYKNGTEIYDSLTKTNIKGTWSKDGQTFNPNDPRSIIDKNGAPVPSVNAETLMQMQGGRYSAGRGETRAEALEKYRESGAATLVQLKNDKLAEYDSNDKMDPTEKSQRLARINAGTQPHVMEEALVAIQARYPDADLNTPAGRTVYNRAAAKWVDELASGTANGSKDFVGFYNREIMEKKMKASGSLRDNVFKVHGTDLDSGMNAYTTTESQIKRIATGDKGDKPADVWILALKGYETTSEAVGSGFKARWEAASEESKGLGESEMMSPELAWLQSLSPPELKAMVDRQRLL